MYLTIPYAIARQIADYAQTAYPNEVCGLLAGKGNHIQLALPIENISGTPATHFQLNPQEQLHALKQIDAAGLEWLGIYHSHPKSPPIPSDTDINDVTDDQLLHLIISLKDNKPKLKAWQIKPGQVTPIELIFDTDFPPDDAHEPLSNTQKVAIILTSILCVMLMLAISLTLLPPAPEITPIP